MIKIKKKLKKIRIHREGTDQLVYGFIGIAAIALLLYRLDNKVPFWTFMVLSLIVYCIVVNFYRCPIRYFSESEDTEGLVVAPADRSEERRVGKECRSRW